MAQLAQTLVTIATIQPTLPSRVVGRRIITPDGWFPESLESVTRGGDAFANLVGSQIPGEVLPAWGCDEYGGPPDILRSNAYATTFICYSRCTLEDEMHKMY